MKIKSRYLLIFGVLGLLFSASSLTAREHTTEPSSSLSPVKCGDVLSKNKNQIQSLMWSTSHDNVKVTLDYLENAAFPNSESEEKTLPSKPEKEPTDRKNPYEKDFNQKSKTQEVQLLSWLKAYKNAFVNPNMQFKRKLKWADDLGKKATEIPFDLIWNTIKDLYRIEYKDQASIESTTLVLYALKNRPDFPESFQGKLAADFWSLPQQMFWPISIIIAKLPSITDPTLIAAIRTYYRSTKNKRLNTNSFRRHIEGYNIKYSADKNMRLEINDQLMRFKQYVMIHVYKNKIIDRTLFYQDCKDILLNEFLVDPRKGLAFSYLLKDGQLDLELIHKIIDHNQSNKGSLKNISREYLKELIAASQLESQSPSQTAIEHLLISCFEDPDIYYRSKFLSLVKDIKIRNASSLSFLKSRLTYLTGQSLVWAKKLLNRSTGNEIPKIGFEKSNIISYDLFRALIQDSLNDTIDFSATNNSLRNQLSDLHKQSNSLSDRDLIKNYLQLIKNEPWHQPLLPLQKNITKPPELEVLPELQWQIKDHLEHSMADIELYLNQRLGSNSISSLKTHNIDVVVFSGDETELFNSNLFKQKHIIKIPNPYSQWDIDRYLVYEHDHPTTMVFRIQANRELAVHYQSMLHALDIKNVKVYLSLDGLRKMKSAFEKAALQLKSQIGEDSEILILGYDYLWNKVLRHRKDWRIIATQKAQVEVDSAAIQAEKIIVGHRSDPNFKKVFLVAGSYRTLWGSSTVRLVEGLLRAQPQIKEILFLGSAGSLGFPSFGRPNEIYYISVPHLYAIDDRKIQFLNSLNLDYYSNHPTFKKHKLSNQTEIEVATCTQHEFSFSPAEQTKDWTTTALNNYSNTVDVETTLIAKFVYDYNQRFTAINDKIRFSAAHLITDNPANNLFVWDVKNSLSAIDAKAKDLLRHNLLDFVLDQWALRIDWPGYREHSLHSIGQYYTEDGSFTDSAEFSWNNYLFKKMKSR